MKQTICLRGFGDVNCDGWNPSGAPVLQIKTIKSGPSAHREAAALLCGLASGGEGYARKGDDRDDELRSNRFP